MSSLSNNASACTWNWIVILWLSSHSLTTNYCGFLFRGGQGISVWEFQNWYYIIILNYFNFTICRASVLLWIINSLYFELNIKYTKLYFPGWGRTCQCWISLHWINEVLLYAAAWIRWIETKRVTVLCIVEFLGRGHVESLQMLFPLLSDHVLPKKHHHHHLLPRCEQWISLSKDGAWILFLLTLNLDGTLNYILDAYYFELYGLLTYFMLYVYIIKFHSQSWYIC
jgi:hypothetical protein